MRHVARVGISFVSRDIGGGHWINPGLFDVVTGERSPQAYAYSVGRTWVRRETQQVLRDVLYRSTGQTLPSFFTIANVFRVASFIERPSTAPLVRASLSALSASASKAFVASLGLTGPVGWIVGGIFAAAFSLFGWRRKRRLTYVRNIVLDASVRWLAEELPTLREMRNWTESDLDILLADTTIRASESTARHVAPLLEAALRRYVPVRTGALQRSIRVTAVEGYCRVSALEYYWPVNALTGFP